VPTDATSGDAVVAYDRLADGSLSLAGSYATSGQGGVLGDSAVDHTASQVALAYDRSSGVLHFPIYGSPYPIEHLAWTSQRRAAGRDIDPWVDVLILAALTSPQLPGQTQAASARTSTPCNLGAADLRWTSCGIGD
jgi:hypothetical protein